MGMGNAPNAGDDRRRVRARSTCVRSRRGARTPAASLAFGAAPASTSRVWAAASAAEGLAAHLVAQLSPSGAVTDWMPPPCPLWGPLEGPTAAIGGSGAVSAPARRRPLGPLRT